MLRLYTCSCAFKSIAIKRLRCVNQLGSDTDDDRDIRVNLSEGKVKLVRDN